MCQDEGLNGKTRGSVGLGHVSGVQFKEGTRPTLVRTWKKKARANNGEADKGSHASFLSRERNAEGVNLFEKGTSGRKEGKLTRKGLDGHEGNKADVILQPRQLV
jgi:hypothetical protein